ncbi:MAG: GMC family oxidoreductase [Proteobacteria bacterium]|nr:GMC family oxidoreductase [Pseudomonadota bacterium]
MSKRIRDVVIIGSGAGGSPLALRLAQAGLDVLVLEKGPRYSRTDYDHDHGVRPGTFTPSLDQDPHTVVTRKTTEPLLTNLGWIASCVGGGTVHMGGYFYRFLPGDFCMRSHFGDYEELADWPYDYDQLEPYYTQAEWEIGISGRAGETPFEGPRSGPYPMPPLDAHPIAAKLDEACRKRGLHPFATPRAVNSRPYQNRPACAYCRHCASYGCPVGARGSAQESLLGRAEATGRCEVRPGSMVREITVGRDGLATGCIYFDRHDRQHEVHSRLVCVSCSAIESARLLLLSTSSRFPDGLANSSGKVGRHLQFHAVTQGSARLSDVSIANKLAIDTPGSSLPFIGRSLLDYYTLPEGVSDIAKGGLLRFDRMMPGFSPPSPIEFRRPDAPPARPPGQPTADSASSDSATTERDYLSLHFEVFHDFIPNSRTFVQLDPQICDRWGLPVARIHLDLPGHQRKAGRWLMQRAFELFDDLGASDMVASDIGGTSTYLVHGTCRAGTDPDNSVLTPWCRAHDVPNLFVVDGSFMPTSGGAAPTLTIMANSFRTADHILTLWRDGQFG